MSEPEIIDAELMTFIDTVVDSVELVEVLSMLSSTPWHWFDASAVAQALATSSQSARLRLERLRSSGLAEIDQQHYRYCPASTSQGEAVTRLLRAYRTHRTRVIDVIVNNPRHK